MELRIQQYDFEMYIVLVDLMQMLMLFPGTLIRVRQLLQYHLQVLKRKKFFELQRRDPRVSLMISYLETGELPENDIEARSIVLTADRYCLSEDEILYHLWEPTSRIKGEIQSRLVIRATLRHDVFY